MNRNDGQIVWQKTVEQVNPNDSFDQRVGIGHLHTDGQHVIAFFGKGGIHCFDVNGALLWSKNLGSFQGPWGTGPSPMIVGNLVIQNCEAEVEASLTAFNIQNGDVVWKTNRDVPDKGGWSTAVPVEISGKKELVLNGFNGVTGYEALTRQEGVVLQKLRRTRRTDCNRRERFGVYDQRAGDIYAVRLGGHGDVTRSHMAWHTPRKAGRDQPSPIVIDSLMLVASMDGIMCGYDVKSGAELWKNRLKGKFTSSPIAANGLAYFQSDEGTTYVIKPGQKLDIVSENVLPVTAADETFRASLSPSNGEMFSRSNETLFCLHEAKQ